MALCCQGFSQTKDSPMTRADRTDTTCSSGLQLDTVTVRAGRPLIIQRADRIVYDLQADPQSKLSSVLDMMRKVPYLSVDGDDNVLLNGSPGYKLFIDGRPSGLVQGNPKEVLRSMPASTVKSIEVITNPPARYDAEGLAGIINIVTIRQAYKGYRASINAAEKGPAGGPAAGGSLTWRKGGLCLSALAGAGRHDLPGTESAMSRVTGGAQQTILQQSAYGSSTRQTAYAGLELSYEADSLNLFSAQLACSGSRSAGQSNQTSELAGASTWRYRLNNNSRSGSDDADISLSYQRGFKKDKDRLLTFSYRYLKSNACRGNELALSEAVNYAGSGYHQRNSEGLAEHTAQIDYVRPLKSLTVEGGFKGAFRAGESSFRYLDFNPATGAYEIDSARTNSYDNSRYILALYNSYAYTSAGWELRAGIRLEETITRANFDRGAAPAGQHYLNVLPVIVANRKFKAGSSLSASYSRRIQRPTAAELNPFVDRSNPDFEVSGNPYLRAITSGIYQLSYRKPGKVTVHVSLGGMFFNHVFSLFPLYSSSTITLLSRYENYGRGRVIKLNTALNFAFTGQWSVAFNSDLRHVAVLEGADSMAVTNSGFDAYVYAATGYRLGKGWQFNADFTYKKGGLSLPRGRVNGFFASSFSASRSLLQSRLTVSAAVSNPFSRYRYASETVVAPDFFYTSSSQSYYRRFTFSIDYRFGSLQETVRKVRRVPNEAD